MGDGGVDIAAESPEGVVGARVSLPADDRNHCIGSCGWCAR